MSADQPTAAGTKWSDLGVRAVSAIILIPAVLADVWVGGIWFNLFAALIGVLMALEWVTIVHREDPAQFALHAAAAMAGALLPFDAGIGAALAAIAVLTAISVVLAARSGEGMWRFLGVPYVSLPAVALIVPLSVSMAPLGVRLAHLMRPRHLEIGFGFFLLIVAFRFFVSLL